MENEYYLNKKEIDYLSSQEWIKFNLDNFQNDFFESKLQTNKILFHIFDSRSWIQFPKSKTL